MSKKLDFEPAVKLPTAGFSEPANWLMFSGDKLVIIAGDVKNPIPYFDKPSRMNVTLHSYHYLGRFRGEPCYAGELEAQAELPLEFALTDMRVLITQLPASWFMLVGRAYQVLLWDSNHRYCGRCSTPTVYHDRDRAKVCPKCALTQYPRISPSVIMLVVAGDKLLLGRSPNFIPSLYSTLAGFVEPGETIEQAVRREVKEEVGVKVGNLNYIASQPWPFPHSLMLGFIAEYEAGDIVVDNDELEDAQWWHIDALPLIPPVGTISRELIDHYVKTRK